MTTLFLFVLPMPAYAQTIEWERHDTEAKAVASSPSGIYVTGDTEGVFPGQPSAGDSDVFVSRFDNLGNQLWIRQFGSVAVAGDYGTGVAADSTGIYVVGGTEGALPGQTRLGSTDAFVRRYDLNGNELWTRQFGTSAPDAANGVAADVTISSS